MRRKLLLLALLAGCSTQPRFEAPRFDGFRDDLLQFAERHRVEMGVPGVWIALLEVDPATGEQHLWADHLGAPVNSLPSAHAREVLATHRVASISKLFTDTAAMVLVERGQLDLDEPIQTYLPEFAPEDPYGVPITLRLLMSHRAGLVRESPVGHYFDADEPSLSATVASLSRTRLVHAPGTTFKYSNPGIGVVGEVVARATGKPFEDAVRDLVLTPLGLGDSDFAPRPDLLARQAHGVMWTYDGRKIATPEWRFGYVPAAELRSTTVDLVRFARSWFPGAPERVIRSDTQASMWVPADANTRCGLGFFVSSLEGHRKVAHGGAVYGFASTLAALPDQGVAVAVVCTKDFANEVADEIADRALRAVLANRRGETLPPPQWPQPLGVERARALAGRWRTGDNWVHLVERDGDLYYDPNIGVRTRLRLAADGSLVADDPLGIGRSRRLTFLPDGNLRGFRNDYVRDDTVPAKAPEELRELLGEYGWDHNALVVYEDQGRLAVLVEWVMRDLPDRVGPDLYSFPPGMYHDDQLRFERDASGAVEAVFVSGARFPRRPGPTAGTFRMQAVRPVPELIAAARATPMPEVLRRGNRPHDLVDLRTIDGGDGLRFDIRYASEDNFLGAKVYDQPVAKLQRPAAEALVRAHRALGRHGVGIQVFDGYRPWWVTKVFWDAAPRHLKLFVADPMRGSRHNRGCAVDLTLYDLKTGEQIEMPSGYDEFTERAYPDYPGGTSRQRHYRELLRRAMEEQGFAVYEHEWWHFDFEEWREYAIGNEPL
ncbi:MAG: serine hydrolase [Planctomycetota bacterium]